MKLVNMLDLGAVTSGKLLERILPIMKYVKYAILWLLALAALCLCGTVVMQIMNFVLCLNLEQVFGIGFKVGFIAWLLLSCSILIHKLKRPV